jgi:hypothetical protein
MADGPGRKITRCDRCGASFATNQNLRKHLARKNPCIARIIREEAEPAEPATPAAIHRCHCSKTYSCRGNLARHQKKCEPPAGGAGRPRDQDIQKLDEKLDRLANLVATAIDGKSSRGVSIGQVTNITNISIRPWDGGSRISIPVDKFVEAFKENPRLVEYSGMGDHSMADPAVSAQLVLDILMDLVRRAHSDPSARNIYLNPRRADQVVLLMKNGKWEVAQLLDATRMILDGVVAEIHMVTCSKQARGSVELPLQAENAFAMTGLMYRGEPEKYAKEAMRPMSAHLTNTAPQTDGDAFRLKLDPAGPRQQECSDWLSRADWAATSGLRRREDPPRLAPRKNMAAPCQAEITAEEVSRLLLTFPPASPGEVDGPYIKRLARGAGVVLAELVEGLWRVVELGCLAPEDEVTARAVCCVADEMRFAEATAA